MIAFYFLLHVLLGAFAGFMGFYFKKLQYSATLYAKFLPYFLFIGIVIILAKCSEILAANLANADTPNFKARDLDFKSVLKKTVASGVTMERTHAGHITPQHQLFGTNLMYRNPSQVSLDGNTVESHVEQAKYAENAVRYQASLSFLSGDFSDMRIALRGQ